MHRKPWEATSQEQFIQLSYEWNKNKVGLRDNFIILGGYKYIRLREHVYPIEHTCHWLYNLGRDYQLLTIHYSEFKNILFNNNHRYNCGTRYPPYISRWSIAFRFSEENYRRQHKFKQKKNKKTEKKQKDLIKLDWWSSQKITRERRKPRWRRKSHTYSKKLNKQTSRRWQRDMLRQERYDSFDNKTFAAVRDRRWWD